MRCVGGVQSMLASQDVLLTDEALMALVGFNAVQVQHGVTARGVSRRKRPVAIRGPISYEVVADNMVKLGPAKLEAMLNGLIACLARQHLFPKHIDCVLDATDDEATPTYKTDDGSEVPKVTREKRPDVRFNRRTQKVKTTVWGWKVWVVWEPTSKIPLAIHIGGIHEADNQHAYAVLAQARKNVAGHATIRSVALDRGFLDGKLLWRIDQDGVSIYIPAKTNLTIATEAREIARRAAAAAAQGRNLEGCNDQERHETVTQGSGKNAVTRTATTIAVGIEELPCDFWTEAGSASSAAHKKTFEPRKLRATVVLRWDGAAKDEDKEVVLLTTDPATDPWVAFDAYDDRSLIENTCNREAKESYFLERHPKRSQAGVRVQAYFVFLAMALMSAFRAHKEKTSLTAPHHDLGITRYRRELEVQNRDKVAVFIGPHFGIFRSFELALLLGATIRERAILGDTVDSVLARCGVARRPPDPADSS